jgi:segregation and condensation protein B
MEKMKDVDVEKIEAVMEAILFTMGEAVDIKKIAQAVEHDEKTTLRIMRNFMDRFNSCNRGIRILEIENSFQMCTKPEMYEYLIRVVSQPKKT